MICNLPNMVLVLKAYGEKQIVNENIKICIGKEIDKTEELIS